ncbi:MAG TPA: hypothetical protein VGF24_30495 [Vicinamibacterales bacterium]|jgi:hypothetical protein
MTPVERDLAELGRFVPRFFGLLGIVVATLPLLDRLSGALPPVLRHQNIASILASIAAYALIGGHFLSRTFRVEDKHPTGLASVIVGVLLAVAYVSVVDALMRSAVKLSVLLDLGLTVAYLSIFCFLTMGFWQMAWRAYKTRDKPTNWGGFSD